MNSYEGAGRPHDFVSHDSAEVKRQAAMLKLQIPRDTRNLTQVFCGDPLPSRSALDKKQSDQARQGSGKSQFIKLAPVKEFQQRKFF